MITINSNASAMMAQNNLFNAQSALTGNMQQLSTGLRINSASDDAAGLQISNRMETQMNGLDVAQRNANDAISMAQTAEGAMSENNTILNRMRDLSLQSANDTNTSDDRAAMQKEVDSLITEVDRISSTTNFAGINLLDGTASNMSFQIGSNAGETISFGIGNMSAGSLGETTAIEGAEVMRHETDGETSGYSFVINTGGTGTDDPETSSDVTINGNTIEELASKVESELNRLEGIDGVSVGIRGDESVDNADARVFDIVAAGDQATALDAAVVGGTGADQKAPDAIKLTVENVDLKTAGGAQIAASVLDNALAQVDEERANLGAVQNRLESTISNLSNIEENLGVSQSRILDADFASQTVEMTSNQMLMQAGTSVLAQAKGMPQYATMLL